MSAFVLDCSVSAAWCLDDESSSAADAIWNTIADSEAIVPAIWVAEMANVLLVAERRGRIRADDRAHAVELLGRLPIHVESPRKTAIADLMRVGGARTLSAYDSCYVELAARRRIPLATLDAGMRAAASEAGIALLPPSETTASNDG